MRATAAVLILFALVVALFGVYYFWTGYVDTRTIQTVFQQIAHGAAATALFVLACASLLGALAALLENVADEIETTRFQMQDEFQRRRYGK